MYEQRPAVHRRDEPLHRRARTMCLERIRTRPGAPRALTIPHVVDRAPTVELRTPLTEAEQRAIAEEEGHAGVRGVEREALQCRAARRLDVNRRRSVGETNDDVARPNPRETLRITCACDGAAELLANQRTGHRYRCGRPRRQRANGDAYRCRTHRPHRDLDRLPGDDDIGSASANRAREHHTRAGCSDLLQRIAPRDVVGHQGLLVCVAAGVAVTRRMRSRSGYSRSMNALPPSASGPWRPWRTPLPEFSP